MRRENVDYTPLANNKHSSRRCLSTHADWPRRMPPAPEVSWSPNLQLAFKSWRHHRSDLLSDGPRRSNSSPGRRCIGWLFHSYASANVSPSSAVHSHTYSKQILRLRLGLGYEGRRWVACQQDSGYVCVHAPSSAAGLAVAQAADTQPGADERAGAGGRGATSRRACVSPRLTASIRSRSRSHYLVSVNHLSLIDEAVPY
ncbi:hypothetical protein C8Q77DRAFT_741889 [Trametes polyzona]|nr:hypothetical protein C8Q77DRAFT_741889 [Trametes polyzona]